MKPLAKKQAAKTRAVKTLAAALAALGLGGAAISPALANTPEPTTINVAIADIDLATAAGQKVLDQRIEKAVRMVCGAGAPQTGTRIPSHASRTCIAKARAAAQQQVAALTEAQQRGG